MVGHENYDYKLNFDAIQKKNESFPGIDELSNFTTTTYSPERRRIQTAV